MSAYVLPLRCDRERELAEPVRYLRWLSARAEVVVVVGSAPPWFERLPDPVHRGWGWTDQVIIADGEVRYGAVTLVAVSPALHDADLMKSLFGLRPRQNCRVSE